MKNIFENAYFGKGFKTRDGRKAIYHSQGSKIEEDGDHLLIIENRYGYYHYDNSGRYYHFDRENDIVSEWQEPIDEEELNSQYECNEKSKIDTQKALDEFCKVCNCKKYTERNVTCSEYKEFKKLLD